MIKFRIILDTDTPESGRIISNANFTIAEDQINKFLNYIDSDFGILKNLYNIETSELKVGSNKLIINGSSSTLNDNLNLNGNLISKGNIIESNLLNVVISDASGDVVGGVYNIGTVSAMPQYYMYRVTSSAVGGLQVNLYPGRTGQKVKVVFVNDPAATETFIKVTNGGSAYMYLPNADYVKLTNVGSSIELIWIEDGWYVNNGVGYTLESSIV